MPTSVSGWAHKRSNFIGKTSLRTSIYERRSENNRTFHAPVFQRAASYTYLLHMSENYTILPVNRSLFNKKCEYTKFKI